MSDVLPCDSSRLAVLPSDHRSSLVRPRIVGTYVHSDNEKLDVRHRNTQSLVLYCTYATLRGGPFWVDTLKYVRTRTTVRTVSAYVTVRDECPTGHYYESKCTRMRGSTKMESPCHPCRHPRPRRDKAIIQLITASHHIIVAPEQLLS